MPIYSCQDMNSILDTFLIGLMAYVKKLSNKHQPIIAIILSVTIVRCYCIFETFGPMHL